MNALLVILVIVGLLVGLAGLAFVSYNKLVRGRNAVENGFAQIDVTLKRRHDLIPNLVETVRGYAEHERQTLDAVITARGGAVSAKTMGERGAAEGMLSQALGKLFALAEAYPDLKANQNFLALQAELTATEDRIAGARSGYNEAVRQYNTMQDVLPTRFFVGLAKATKAEYFEVTDEGARQAPRVQF